MSTKKSCGQLMNPRQRPLEPTKSDHHIFINNGTTVALELTRWRLQEEKKRKPLTGKERDIRAQQELGVYKREIRFQRSCHDADLRMINEV